MRTSGIAAGTEIIGVSVSRRAGIAAEAAVHLRARNAERRKLRRNIFARVEFQLRQKALQTVACSAFGVTQIAHHFRDALRDFGGRQRHYHKLEPRK